MKALLLLLLAVCVAFPVSSQRSGPGDRATGDESEGVETEYEPYSEDEFPEWLQTLRRAEVIFIGAFPVAMLFTSLAYDGYKAVRTAITDEASTGPTAVPIGEYSADEGLGILIAGAGLSLVVALVDYFLGLAGGAVENE